MKIGFFDSGLGGLTILQATAQLLPEYDYVFFGDTKNLPYGDKTEEEIYQFSERAIADLFERGCTLVVIACNTASAETLRRLQDTFLFKHYPERRILGVIIPTVEEVIDHHARNVILLATKRTIESKKYETELTNRTLHSPVMHGIATPELVPLIEAGKLDMAVAHAAQTISDTMTRVGEVDTVVLGCTHYTKLKTALREKFPNLRFISQDEVIPHKLQTYFRKHTDREKTLSRNGTRDIILSEHREDYDQIVAELLNGSFIGKGN
ncbi:MAG: glutamate racemase [Candidatus Paceibacterota bacterium]